MDINFCINLTFEQNRATFFLHDWHLLVFDLSVKVHSGSCCHAQGNPYPERQRKYSAEIRKLKLFMRIQSGYRLKILHEYIRYDVLFFSLRDLAQSALFHYAQKTQPSRNFLLIWQKKRTHAASFFATRQGWTGTVGQSLKYWNLFLPGINHPPPVKLTAV